MTDKTTELIAKLKKIAAVMPWLGVFADALEAEHQRAERYQGLARRTELQCQDAEADVQKAKAERDALRNQLDMLIENSARIERGPVPWVEIDADMWDRILSRAIDSKEEKP